MKRVIWRKDQRWVKWMLRLEKGKGQARIVSRASEEKAAWSWWLGSPSCWPSEHDASFLLCGPYTELG